MQPAATGSPPRALPAGPLRPRRRGWRARARRVRAGSVGQDAAVGEDGVRQAVLVVLRDHDLGRVLAAGRATRVAPHLERAEALLQRVVGEEATDERVAEVEQ